MELENQKKFPATPKDYKLYEEVGEGVSATVYRALCIPRNEIVAIKVLDLEKCNNDLDGIRREVQTMILIDHPNLLRAYCSFPAGHSLWVVMPYMAGGSCLHIMKSDYPDGFEEPVIATLLREVLKALVYLHGQGHIHRDVKAGNILIDANGAVKLADFGVSACMFDAGDRQRSRNTFVGTPCWMAPEVMQQLHGYDFKADIWSFGITALELAHGHAPFSKYPPMKVLLMTLQNAPPGLDYERDKRFSKSFKDLVATCLVKDPKKRPTSEKLLKHPFFKHARSNEYLVKTILDGLVPLGERFRELKGKEADFLIQNKSLYGDKEQLSQQEYIRGISAWNFNLDDLKAQAALIQSLEQSPSSEDGHKDGDVSPQIHALVEHAEASPSEEDRVRDLQELEGTFASVFPSRPLEALKACFDVCEDDVDVRGPDPKDTRQPNLEPAAQHSSQPEALQVKNTNGDYLGRSSSLPKNIAILGSKKISSGSLLPEHVLSSSKVAGNNVERDEIYRRHQHERNFSGPLLHRHIRDVSARDESSEGRVVQRKGRFSVTSADSGPKGAQSANSLANSVNGIPPNPTVNASLVFPTLQFLLQQNAIQQEQLTKLIKCLEPTSGHKGELSHLSGDLAQSLTSNREKELQAYVVQLQLSVGSLAEEVQKLKSKNTQLELQINALLGKETAERE